MLTTVMSFFSGRAEVERKPVLDAVGGTQHGKGAQNVRQGIQKCCSYRD
jgi:hypothetical protein